MDPNPKSLPILSYVMSKIPSVGPRRSAADSTEFDIEQPPPSLSPSKEPYFELTERMPHLTDPKVVAEMRLAVADVAQTRSVLSVLGERPDHESVDAARAKLAEIDSNSALADAAKQIEKQAYKAVLSVDEMHEAYAKMLDEAEKRLQKIYDKAVVAGGDVAAPAPEKDIPTSSTGMEEVDEEVVRILREAIGKEIETINLSGRNLLFLPEAFGQLRSLRAFDLSNNQLEFVPDSIGGLGQLEELNLSSNVLELLPDSIGLLHNLKILNVSGNKLAAFPDSICHCRSLVEIDASFNKLTYLPTNMGYELVNLKRLSVPLNKIRSLPSSIGEMISLHYLDVHFNELHGLPLSIGRLKNLEILNLSSNFSDLTFLPDNIGDLSNLKELDLSNNQIHALPNTFGRLQRLSRLNVEENPLVIPPKEVVNDGVEAVKVYMSMRWLDILAEEEQKSMAAENEQVQPSLLNRSTSWLGSVMSSVSGYLGATGKSDADPYLNQQL